MSPQGEGGAVSPSPRLYQFTPDKRDTAMFTEKFDRYACVNDQIECEHEGFTIRAHIAADLDAGAPWLEDEGHGFVSEWTRRAKLPGERVLGAAGRKRYLYDFARTVKKARKENWGSPDAPTSATQRQRAALAVEKDFEVLRAWCNDEWSYCGVIVTIYREGFELGSASLWRVEMNYPDSDNAYLNEVAEELAEEALTEARATIAKLCAA